MVFFKGCERCSGDQFMEEDRDGWYVACFACGYVTYPEIEAADVSTLSASVGGPVRTTAAHTGQGLRIA